MDNRQNVPLSALGKGLAVLEAVLSNERLADVTRVTGLPASTVHRILGELGAGGWIYQEGKRWRPGRRMLALSGLLRDDAEVQRHAQPALAVLREATGMTVHFGLLKHDEIMYAAKLDGHGSYRMLSRVGGFAPLHSTSIGKSVLATMTDAQVAATMERTGMRRVTSATRTTLAKLGTDLQATRQRGWALDYGENEEHLRCVGAAVFDATGRCIGGVSVSALEFELLDWQLPGVAEFVMRAAAEISRSLGHEARPSEGERPAVRAGGAV